MAFLKSLSCSGGCRREIKMVCYLPKLGKKTDKMIESKQRQLTCLNNYPLTVLIIIDEALNFLILQNATETRSRKITVHVNYFFMNTFFHL